MMAFLISGIIIPILKQYIKKKVRKIDVEFNVRREGEGGALVLSCTKMKDSEEPTTRAYDLSPLNLYIDNDGEEVNSLVV